MADEYDIRTLVADAEDMAKIEQVEELFDTIGTELWPHMLEAFASSPLKLQKRIEDGNEAAREARVLLRRRDRYDLLMQAEATDVAALVRDAATWVRVITRSLKKMVADEHPEAEKAAVMLRVTEDLRPSARASEDVVRRLLEGLDGIGFDAKKLGLIETFFLGGQMIVDKLPVENAERVRALRDRMGFTRLVTEKIAVIDKLLIDLAHEASNLKDMKVDVPGLEMQILRASRGRAGGPRPVPVPAPAGGGSAVARPPIGAGLPPLDPEGEEEG